MARVHELALTSIILCFASVAYCDEPGKGYGLVHVFQAKPDPNLQAVINQVFPDFPEFDSYLARDVDIASGWVILGEVTTYFTNSGNNGWEGVTMAVLNLFEDDGQLDTEDPTTGMIVPVTVIDSDGDGILEMTASDLNILLVGHNWIGLTPIAEFGVFGQEFQTGSSSSENQETHLINPGGGFGFGTKWAPVSEVFTNERFDAALTVLGYSPQLCCVDLYAWDFDVIRGIQTAGELASLCAIDGDKLVVQAGPVFGLGESPVDAEIRFRSTSR